MEETLPVIKRPPSESALTQEWMEKRYAYVPTGIGNTTSILAVEGKGALIKDIEGNVYLDFAAGIGVQNVGHCHEAVVKAISQQAAALIHPCFHVTMYDSYIQLAQKLCESVPISGEKRAMLANSGAEAVENAIKIARRYTKKTGIVSLETAFHGRTYMTMTLTSKVKPYKNGFGPFMGDTYKIPAANCYRCPYGLSYPMCGGSCADKFEQLLQTELAPETIAALIIEPVQGEGGFIPLPPQYLKKLQAICKANDIVFIVDEIQSGFGRTGYLFASEGLGIEPDIMTLSKGIAAGIPISAVVGRAEIMNAPQPGEIGGTYGGSPIGCVAALAVLEIIEREGLCEKAQGIGKRIRETMLELKKTVPMIGDVRGMGAMMAIELVKDPVTKIPNKEAVGKIIKYALDRGVIFLSAGIYGNVLRFLPPLVMTEAQLTYGLNVLTEAVLTVSNEA